MLYLHVIDTNDNNGQTKSMFIEDEESYRIGQLISTEEKDNLVIINSIEIDRKRLNKRKIKIIHIFLNGKEDVNYSEKLKVNRKK